MLFQPDLVFIHFRPQSFLFVVCFFKSFKSFSVLFDNAEETVERRLGGGFNAILARYDAIVARANADKGR